MAVQEEGAPPSSGVVIGNLANGLSRQCWDCRQCELIEKRDGGPTHSEMVQALDFTDPGDGLNRLWTTQATGNHPVAQIYQCVKANVLPTEEIQEKGSVEFKRLAQLQEVMRIDRQGVLQVGLNYSGQKRWCTVCPRSWHKGIIQEIHVQAHVRVQKTLKRLRLDTGIGRV